MEELSMDEMIAMAELADEAEHRHKRQRTEESDLSQMIAMTEAAERGLNKNTMADANLAREAAIDAANLAKVMKVINSRADRTYTSKEYRSKVKTNKPWKTTTIKVKSSKPKARQYIDLCDEEYVPRGIPLGFETWAAYKNRQRRAYPKCPNCNKILSEKDFYYDI